MAITRRLTPAPSRQEPKSPFLFTSERGAPFTTAGFTHTVERVGKTAKLSFKAHLYMLRHACGYALANRGYNTWALQAYVGQLSSMSLAPLISVKATRDNGAYGDARLKVPLRAIWARP
jgi:type 1 fimbriae regulatory protein FimB/type 1 fimbriae regulatory protein FimE